MRHFHRLAQGINTLPLLHAALRQNLWNANSLRTGFEGSAHAEADDIWLRFNASLESASEIMDDLDCINYPALAVLPQARPIIFDLMRLVEGERLGRVLITRLKPGGKISRHADEGGNANHYDRYHVALQGLPGSLFRDGDEEVSMQTGECWWFDNQQPHEVINNSANDRIHMIVDIAPC